MPNEPYVEEIMVADGDGDHPEIKNVKMENLNMLPDFSPLFIDEQGYISIDYDYVPDRRALL